MTFTAHSPETAGEQQSPQPVAQGVFITVHGHFYQPPRENPYLDVIERQGSAAPFHDWNERICHECYRPNAFARIENDQGEVADIVNNFEYLSFNIGPTLMSWLKTHDLEVYQKIIEGDRRSAARLNGHGNAIAQVYNHIIMPLANKRDKYTQIRWGKADFRQRFGREPEGIWLAETAIDADTVEALIDEGLKFTILAPSQAQRCRPLATEDDPDPQWHEVGGGQIDPSRPYRCHIQDGRYLDIFFYDGPISRDMGFNEVLSSADHFAGRLGQAIHGDHRPSQIISVATDGETFGHHKKYTEKCIAYSLTQGFPARGWQVTNYGHYLSLFPPTWEVELKPVTAWSCSHGVERWQSDCGCAGGGAWNQQWRSPLRRSLNWLRDRLEAIYDYLGPSFFQDPWGARDEYVEILLHRNHQETQQIEVVEQFLARHQCRQLNPAEQVDGLRLLEMQRHALLMFTSCGWFFEEISRPEGVQILRYGARAIELAAEVSGQQLEKQFLEILALAVPNIKTYRDGRDLYQQMVLPSQVTFKQVVAHYALSSLFHLEGERSRLYCYDLKQIDYQKQQLGSLTLAVGHVSLTSSITWENNHYVFAVVHLGGWEFHCGIKPFGGRGDYAKLKEELFASLHGASVVELILVMGTLLGEHSFNLKGLFTEERHRIMDQLTRKTKQHLDQLYSQIYRDNYSILLAFQREELPVPQELQVAADVALSARCKLVLAQLQSLWDQREDTLGKLQELGAIAEEARLLQSELEIPQAREVLERLTRQSLQYLLYSSEPATLDLEIQILHQFITVGKQLGLGLDLHRVQELYFEYFHREFKPHCLMGDRPSGACRWSEKQFNRLLELGKKLRVAVEP